jgi:Xaa-Pro dipeptidase
MRKLGSEGFAFDTIVASGTNSAFPHGGCTNRKIESGDLVMLDLGAIYGYYRTDMTRTVVMGKPSAEQAKIFEIVRKAQDKAFQKIQDGSRASDIDLWARNTIIDEGYGDKFVHGLGHGLGLEIHEPPTLNSESKEILRTGNVVTVEPGIYIPNFGGVRIEDTVLIRKQKAEKLTKLPDDLITI